MLKNITFLLNEAMKSHILERPIKNIEDLISNTRMIIGDVNLKNFVESNTVNMQESSNDNGNKKTKINITDLLKKKMDKKYVN